MSQIDLSKPVWCGKHDLSERIAVSHITKKAWAMIGKAKWEWEFPSGFSLGPWPPLSNVPPEPADREGEEKRPSLVETFAKLRELSSGYWDQFNTNDEINEALGRTDPQATRIAALEGMVRELYAELYLWYDEHDNGSEWDANTLTLINRAKNLLNEQ